MVALRYRTKSATRAYGIIRGIKDWQLHRLRVVLKEINYDGTITRAILESSYTPITESVLPHGLRISLGAHEYPQYSVGYHVTVAMYVDHITGINYRYVMSQEKDNAPITTSVLKNGRATDGRIVVVDGWTAHTENHEVYKHLMCISNLILNYNSKVS